MEDKKNIAFMWGEDPINYWKWFISQVSFVGVLKVRKWSCDEIGERITPHFYQFKTSIQSSTKSSLPYSDFMKLKTVSHPANINQSANKNRHILPTTFFSYFPTPYRHINSIKWSNRKHINQSTNQIIIP